MLGLNVKRGVETTLERIFKSSGNEFGKLAFHWTGKTAGINFQKTDWRTNATLVFPAIDENANIDNATFSNLIGYAIHELGHAWYTDNRPWDKARNEHGTFVNNLINGLEDPRIERLVIESGRAPNSRALFENLLNSILDKNGYVEPDDKRNIPFLLAVEGRRLNGYAVNVPSITHLSPYAKHLTWALKRANTAKDTSAIVKIAIELFKRLKEQDEQAKQEQDEGQGEGQGQDGEGQPSDGQPQDGQGQGQPTDGNGEAEGDANGEGEGQGSPADGKPTDGDSDGQPQESDVEGDKSGSGKSFEGGREVEPSEFIKDILGKHSALADQHRPRPAIGHVDIATFTWS